LAREWLYAGLSDPGTILISGLYEAVVLADGHGSNAKPKKLNSVPLLKIGGAVGVLPPESEKPDQSFLQAQLRFLLTRTYSSKRGLPFAADSVSYTALESVNRASPIS